MKTDLLMSCTDEKPAPNTEFSLQFSHTMPYNYEKTDNYCDANEHTSPLVASYAIKKSIIKYLMHECDALLHAKLSRE